MKEQEARATLRHTNREVAGGLMLAVLLIGIALPTYAQNARGINAASPTDLTIGKLTDGARSYYEEEMNSRGGTSEGKPLAIAIIAAINTAKKFGGQLPRGQGIADGVLTAIDTQTADWLKRAKKLAPRAAKRWTTLFEKAKASFAALKKPGPVPVPKLRAIERLRGQLQSFWDTNKP